MSFWTRSIRQVRPVRRDPARARRAPSRGCRFRLEDLEGRSLLSTIAISEYMAGPARHVVVQVDNSPPSDQVITGSPPSTFVFNANTLQNTIDVLNTSAGVPVRVNAANTDTVNVGNAGSVQGILAPVTIDSPPSWNTINIDDSADPAARYVQLNTFTSDGASWGNISGLAPAAISYKYDDTSSVSLATGTGANTVMVFETGVRTYITNNGPSTVSVGNPTHGFVDGVQGILGALYITNPPSWNTINIDDTGDNATRAVTLNTVSSGGASWGEVTGLAPEPISYKYADTWSMNLTTGDSATVNVLATGVTTAIHAQQATVNVGNAGSVQGILGSLSVDAPPGFATLNVDDSADSAPRTVTMFTTPGIPSEWGNITGLAPATIAYQYLGTSSLNLTTSPANVTVDVQATGVPTYISTIAHGSFSGHDTVNVGHAGSVQGILGALYVYNPPGYTALNIDDSADFGQRDATLSSFSNGPDSGPWGSITGLAPAAIDFACNDMYNHVVNVSAPLGGNISWTVDPDAYASAMGVNVLLDGYDIN
jgi:hypothetical protein